MNRIASIILILVLGAINLQAQQFPDRGISLINNYTPDQYGQAGKIWAIESADNGLVYFAADRGLLTFNGEHWKRFVGSKGITRSLLLPSDSVFYSGADKDFGQWHKNEYQDYVFTSLNPFRESAKGLNEEFWGVHQIDEDIIFVSFNNIYVYKEQQLTKIAAPSRFTGSFKTGGKVYLADDKFGLYAFNGLRLTNVFPQINDVGPIQIVGVHEDDQGLLIITRDQGIFRFLAGKLTPMELGVSADLQKNQVFCFTTLDNHHFAFGTILNGIYITDKAGQIVQHINKQRGLQNNTILSLHYSEQGILWAGMDFGIAAIKLASNIT
ncbi:MAG: hypothetical protein AAFU67_13290, partial [Bacteroidota bacterium]